MQKPFILIGFVVLILTGQGLLASETSVMQAGSVSHLEGFVPVVEWEVARDGFETTKHGWVAGSDKMLRVNWAEQGWYGFKPVFCDVDRGLVAIEVHRATQEGESLEKLGAITVVAGKTAYFTIPSTETTDSYEITLSVLDVKEISYSDLPQPGEIPANAKIGGGGGLGSCCVSCGGTQACDCSACLSCDSCCNPGCYCVTCN